jgi:NAD(P)H-hydrate epimerase
MKLVTSAQMRELERAAIDAGSSEAQLMEEAGLAVAQEAWMLLGTLEGRRIVVLAGPGNNGGDGLVAARHLFDWGADVAVYLPSGHRTTGRLDELRQREIPVVEPGAGQGDLDALLGPADLVIDALLGIGLQRPIEDSDPIGVSLERLRAARDGFQPPKLVAVDIPSGVNADSGAMDARTVTPDITVTFGLPKVGMYQAPASGHLGKVQVIDIGIPKAAMEAVGLELLTARWARAHLPARPEDGNKGTFGKVLVVGGCARYPGALQLSATAAYRAGAGLVTVACPESIVAVAAPGIAEATWLPQPAADDGTLSETAAIGLRATWQDYSAVVFGPGMGNSADTRALVWAVLPDTADAANGVVIDADALNVLAGLDDGPERVPAGAILTPHPGEMARLMRTTVNEVQAQRMKTAQECATKYGCVVVLKGAHSVIAAPDGRVSLSPFANALLATAGSGDVLAGMAGGYLAQGVAPFEAAGLAVYLHGAVGEVLNAEYGTAGLLAGEIASRLPGVVRDVSAS